RRARPRRHPEHPQTDQRESGQEPAGRPRRKADTFKRSSRRQAEDPQVTGPPPPEPSRIRAAPMWHPRDTHRPHRTEMAKDLNRIAAAQTSDDVARPKGLEPRTF